MENETAKVREMVRAIIERCAREGWDARERLLAYRKEFAASDFGLQFLADQLNPEERELADYTRLVLTEIDNGLALLSSPVAEA